MNRQTKLAALIAAVLLCVPVLAGCGLSAAPVRAADDEILLRIRLDLREDIGLLILDAEIDGAQTGGGVSNADRTPLRRDETLTWPLSRRDFGDPGDPAAVTLRFRIVTAYCDPNYENEYPEDLTVALDPVSFTAAFGSEVPITITGDREHGYRAAVALPEAADETHD